MLSFFANFTILIMIEFNFNYKEDFRMKLMEKTQELNVNIDNIMEAVSKEIGTFKMLKSMNPNELIIMQQACKLYDEGKELLMEYAKGIEEIHKQNEEILSLLKERRIESN